MIKPPIELRDYGQESFTLSQIKAYRKQDEQERKAKEKKTNRISTK